MIDIFSRTVELRNNESGKHTRERAYDRPSFFCTVLCRLRTAMPLMNAPSP